MGGANNEDIFQTADDEHTSVFAQREILQIDYVPPSDRIVGRTEQMQELGGQVGPVTTGEPPNSTLIYGKTGCGKSLVAKHVARLAEDRAQDEGVQLATAYENCQQAKGNFEILSKLGSSINPEGSTISFPARGLAEGEYLSRLWDVLNEFFDGALFILDEVDSLKDDSVLMTFSRAGEDGSVDIPIGVVAISNKINYRNRMNERTKSSFGHSEIVFEPYDATQLREILENRRDAFVKEALDDGVIARTAALSAKEHGDARKAVRLLRYAGEEANRNRAGKVTEQHVNDARASAETDRLLELISTLPPHSKYLLWGLANLTNNQPDKEWFRTTEIRGAYLRVCEKLSAEEISVDRGRDLLNELSFLEVTDKRRGQGDGKGRYHQHTLLWDTDIIFRIEDHVKD